MDISKKLKKLRETKELRQTDIADYLSVSRKTVSGWENRRSFPDINSLVKISKLYSVSLDNLLDDDRMLAQYQEQSQHEKRMLHTYAIVYFLEIIFLILGFLRYLGFLGFIKVFIPITLLLLSIIIITIYPHWGYLKKSQSKLFGIAVFLISMIIFIIHIMFFAQNAITNASDVNFIIGEVIGKATFAVVLSIGIFCVLILHPRHNNY